MRYRRILCGLSCLLAGAAATASTDSQAMQGDSAMDLTIPVFRNGKIPTHYTCDGDNVSPPMSWENPPEGTRSIALIAEDPDAPGGTFTHWVMYNIPPDISSLPEDVRHDPTLANGSLQGKNDFGKIGFGGPCPPGGTHNYHFKLYALDTELNLPAGASKEELLDAMEGHVISETQVVGKYTRH